MKARRLRLIDTLDRELSKIIRFDRDKGVGCITCGVMNAVFNNGHYMVRGRHATRFHPWNVAKQCVFCNKYKGGEQAAFGFALDEKFGIGTSRMMFLESRKLKTWSIPELEGLIKAARRDYKTYLKAYSELSPVVK